MAEKDGTRGMTANGLVKCVAKHGLLDKKTTANDVQLVYQATKLGNKTELSYERFQEALRKLAVKKGTKYQDVAKIMVDGGNKLDFNSGPKSKGGMPRGFQELKILVCTWNVDNA